MNPVPRSRFQVGQPVVHRISGRLAIVSKVHTRCSNPKHKFRLACLFSSSECQLVPTGFYELSLDFEEDLINVPEEIIEEAGV